MVDVHLEVLEQSPVHAFARCDALLMCVWRGRTGMDSMHRLLQFYREQYARYPGGFNSVVLLEHGVPLERDPEIVAFARKMSGTTSKMVRHEAMIIPHAGFAGTMLRMVIRAAGLANREMDQKVFSALDDGLVWLTKGSVEMPPLEPLMRVLPAALDLRGSSLCSRAS